MKPPNYSSLSPRITHPPPTCLGFPFDAPSVLTSTHPGGGAAQQSWNLIMVVSAIGCSPSSSNESEHLTSSNLSMRNLLLSMGKYSRESKQSAHPHFHEYHSVITNLGFYSSSFSLALAFDMIHVLGSASFAAHFNPWPHKTCQTMPACGHLIKIWSYVFKSEATRSTSCIHGQPHPRGRFTFVNSLSCNFSNILIRCGTHSFHTYFHESFGRGRCSCPMKIIADFNENVANGEANVV